MTLIKVTDTMQCQILYNVFIQSADAYHTNGVLYGTMGVLITLIKV